MSPYPSKAGPGGPRRRRAGTALALVVAVAVSGVAVAELAPSLAPGGGPARSAVKPNLAGFGSQPLSFEPNAGQEHSAVRFSARAAGAHMSFTATDMVLALTRPQARATMTSAASKASAPEVSVLRTSFIGANPAPEVAPGAPLGAKVNYLRGSDPKGWVTELPTYRGIGYPGLYPGIDLAYDGPEGQLKSTYTVAPGADPSAIRWRYEGARSVSVDRSGDLRVKLVDEPGGSPAPVVTEKAPVVWQDIDGRRNMVPARYDIGTDDSVGFSLGNYDRSQALVIDPTLEYSKAFGGSDYDYATDIAVDAAGNTYLTGWTASPDFPTSSGSYRPDPTPVEPKVDPVGWLLGDPLKPPWRYVTSTDAFVTKFSADGSRLYSTYLGGSKAGFDRNHGTEEGGNAIAVDGAGNAYITGTTRAKDFPTTPGAYQPAWGPNAATDSFVTKLNSNGSALVYSTYLGGSSHEAGNGIAVDATGRAYVTGSTSSTDFLTNLVQAHSNSIDAFVAKFNPEGTALDYATYIGGTNVDEGTGIAVDATGNAYVVGETSSADFPTTQSPDQPGDDAFVTKLNSTGGRAYSTYLGGSGDEEGNAIAVDTAGNAYVTGKTSSANFPTTPSPDQPPTTKFDTDAFATKFDTLGSLLYSTYLGGGGDEVGRGIAVDSAGSMLVAGDTASTDFPVTNPTIQKEPGGSLDAFFAVIKPSQRAISFATYLGGSAIETAASVGIDGGGNAYLAGSTTSGNFPKVGIGNPGNKPNVDILMAKIAGAAALAPNLLSVADAAPVAEGSPAAGPYHTQGAARFTVSLLTPVSTAVTVKYRTVDGTAKATATPTPTGASDYTNTSGTLSFAAGVVSQVMTVPVSMDNSVEDDEDFFLQLSDPSSGVALADAQGRATIVSDDPNTSTLSIGDVEVLEGVAGTTTQAVFTLSLSRPAAGAVTARVSTVGGTAHSTNNDFVATTQDVTFARDEMTKQVAVTVKGDDIAEPNEYFFLQLESSFGAYPANRRGTATIRSDDDDTVVSVSDVSMLEGASGATTAMAFTVSLSEPSYRTVTVGYATTNGTTRTTDNATMGAADYSPVSGTLTFAPGESSKTVVVNVIGDDVMEADEEFFLNLTSTANAISAKRAGVGTIQNDDCTSSTPFASPC